MFFGTLGVVLLLLFGSNVVGALQAAGHEVVGTTRSSAKADALRAARAEPLVLDILDREATVEAVTRVAPDAIVSVEMTSP